VAFVLRYEAENYFVPEPRELGLSGNFAVFKMIETDALGERCRDTKTCRAKDEEAFASPRSRGPRGPAAANCLI
jgi:hypothetical protein